MEVLHPTAPIRAVVVVAHGLNQRASALRELHEALRARGAAVVVLQLRGHRLDSEEEPSVLEAWRALRWGEWTEDWRRAAETAAGIAAEHHVPLTFLGYSLGALVHVHALSAGEGPGVPFTRQVLLAPALSLHPWVRAGRVMRVLSPRFLLPALTPPPIRSHAATSVAAYDALFRYEAAVSIIQHPECLRIPTLVFIDERDELVSAARLRRWVAQHGLARDWRIHTLMKDRATAGSIVRHYITDQVGLGAAAFSALVERVGAALVDGEGGPGDTSTAETRDPVPR